MKDPDKHDLIEFAPAGPLQKGWMVRCTCGWYLYEVSEAFEACRRFAKHYDPGGFTWDDMEGEYETGRTDGIEVGRDEGYEQGWEEGRKDLIKALEELRGI